QHEFGSTVEKLGSVDKGEVIYLVHAAHRPRYHGGIANITGDELDFVRPLAEPSWRAARVIIEHAHGMSVPEQCLDQSGSDEPAPTSHKNRTHSRFSVI